MQDSPHILVVDDHRDIRDALARYLEKNGMRVTTAADARAMDAAMRGGALVASFPVEMDDQIMLATSRGQSIRVPVEGISFRSRSAGGVKVFNTGAGEEVVSVARIADQGDDEEENGSDE